MKKYLLLIIMLGIPVFFFAQEQEELISSFWLKDSVRVTIDRPAKLYRQKETIICFYALPNGNTTEQTMGKKRREGIDWHFDIQHIQAQTGYIRKRLSRKNFVVIYLENNLKSWPAWKQKNPDFKNRIPAMIDSLSALVATRKKAIYLNGHSGGGSFIFGYLAAVEKIPTFIRRISFLDSNYGYDSSYYPKFRDWLLRVNGSALNVFAYNDSVALYNGKPVVSAHGGTWYRSRKMLEDLSGDFLFTVATEDSILSYKSRDKRVQFFFKENPDRNIYHTQQVEFNGFIHSILSGTKSDSKGYRYYSGRAYAQLIEE